MSTPARKRSSSSRRVPWPRTVGRGPEPAPHCRHSGVASVAPTNMEVYERPPSQLGTARFPTDETSMSVAGEHKKASEGGALELIKIVFHAIIIAVVVRTLLFQPFNIPSGSLIPTLLIGDYIFVSKFSYGYSKYSIPFGPNLFNGRIWSAPPQRGDIAVFKLPKDNSTDYIKRVIGLPGDRIQMTAGILQINGQPVKRERLE